MQNALKKVLFILLGIQSYGESRSQKARPVFQKLALGLGRLLKDLLDNNSSEMLKRILNHPLTLFL